MAFESGKAGVTKGERTALDKMSRWDNSENVTINASDLALTSGVLGDGNSGVGDGKSRVNYLCYGIHNASATAATIKYTDIKGGTSNVFTLYIPAGGWAMPLVQITGIKGTGTGTTATTLLLMYKDKYAMDETGPIQSITE